MTLVITPGPEEAALSSLASPIIEVSGLRKAYGSTLAVKDVSFAVDEGEILAFSDPTALERRPPSSAYPDCADRDGGSVSVLGLDPKRDRAALRECVGVQLQEGSLRPKLTVGETVDLFASFYPKPASAGELLEMLGLAAKRDSLLQEALGWPEAASVGSRSL